MLLVLKRIVDRFSSFTYLNITQFTGALNDNIYKLLIVYFAIQLVGIEHSHIILSSTGAVFVLPFLLFSASSGMLADRFSKRNIIVFTKIFEVVIISLAVLAFARESILGAYAVLFLLATQSALFGPSKYGIIPEIVPSDKISKANGMMTSFTFLAIILGTFFASFLLDITNKDFIVAAIFCLLVAIVGMGTSFAIEETPPSGSSKKISFRFISEIYRTLKEVKKEPSLLTAVLGSAFFLFLGAYAQLNMIPFAVHSLGLTDVQGGYLFLLTALGIGTGSILAGKVSGKTVELGLVPLAAFGIATCCFLLDFFSYDIAIVIPFVVLLGMVGGMYQIPLDSYIQVASPTTIRGQVVAAANFLSFFGVLLASFLLYALTEVFQLSASEGFSVMGWITIFVGSVFTYQFFDYLTRFVSMILSKLHFKTEVLGEEYIPEKPAIYVCKHTEWNDTLLLLGSQRRRIRFFIEEEKEHGKWMRRLYRLLRVVLSPTIEPLENNQVCHAVIRRSLQKGISVCVFTNNDALEEYQKLASVHSLQDVLAEYPIIPVSIEKGEKEKEPLFFKRLMNKVWVPATISFGHSVVESS